MKILIFGPERPKLSFEQDPEQGAIIRCDNEYVLEYDPRGPITWRSTANELRRIDPKRFEGDGPESTWISVIEILKDLCQTDTERIFLTKIAKEEEAWQWMQYPSGELNLPARVEEWRTEDRDQLFELVLNEPALIPQAWVNWIHYDQKDRKRAEKRHLQPFRVDFLRQGPTYEAVLKRIVVEIDDMSHIADNGRTVRDSSKLSEAKPSLVKFTEHLRKDRWLRCHGWEVCRFSTLEVEKEKSDYLFLEMQGGLHWIDPSYFPHNE